MKLELQGLHQSIANLLEAKFDMIKELDTLIAEMTKLERMRDGSVNWSFLLEDLKAVMEDINLNVSLNFIDDIEEQVNDLEYKEKRAIQKMRESVNPILKNTPVYFDAANPPAMQDYADKTTAKEED
jgi:hypothetical protein